MNTCIYLRKSRADEEAERQGEYETLSRHKSTLLKVAKEKNLNIIEIKEELVSGESVANRPKMLELLDEVENGLYDAVLVMDIDRLGRGNMQDQGLILDTFKISNTKIITPRKVYDLSNEWDEEYSEFEAFMARKELKIINRRMQRGRIKSIEEGNFIATNPPFGYKIEYLNNGRNRILVIDKEQAKIVKTIFDMYTKGNGANKIASHINALGVKTNTGGVWKDKAVRDILKNKIYCGYVTWNKVSRKVGKQVKKDKDQWIIAKGKHEPIISEDLWNKCSEIREKRFISPTKSNGLTNPLAGIVICGLCGHTLVAKSSTVKQQDGTNKYIKYMTCTHCLNRGTKLYILEDIILKELKKWLNEYEVEISNINTDINDNAVILDDYKKIISNLNKELSELDKQKNNLHDLLERGIYDVDTYLDRQNNIAERIKTINKTINDTKIIINNELKKEQAKTDLIPVLKNVLEQYYIIDDITLKNNLLKSVLDKVIYTKNHKRRDEYKFNITLYPKLPK